MWLDLKTIYWKDLLHSFRDKDVFIYTFLVPALLYPLLLLGSAEVMMFKAEADKGTAVKYAISGLVDPGIAQIDQILQKHKPFVKVFSANAEKDLAEGKIDGVIARHQSDSSSFVEIKVNKLARMAALDDQVNAETNKAFTEELTTSLIDRGLARENLEGFSVSSFNLAAPNKADQKQNAALPSRRGRHNLENISPTFVLLIFSLLMLGLGAAYPAIAVTAEEFERNTIETSCLLPASRSLLMFGKLSSVATFALLSGLINFISLFSVAQVVLSQTKLFSSVNHDMLAINLSAAQIIGLLLSYVLVGILISSLLILATSFCRTVRSAQQWTTFPLFVILILPPCALSPSLELNAITMWLPLINCSLMLKAIFNGTVYSANFAIVALVSLLTSWFALGLARLFLFEQIDPGSYFSRRLDKLMAFITGAKKQAGEKDHG